MAPELAKAVGYQLSPTPVSWNKRDLLAYAVGVGAKKDDLSLVYELDKNFASLPTYPVVLGLKGADEDVTLFASKFRSEPIPGMPQMDPRRVVHATQSIEVLKDLPHVSGKGWTLSTRVAGVSENKTGIVLMQESLLLDPQGTPYAKLFSSVFNLGAVASGDKFSKSVSGPPQAKAVPKDRKPDYVFKDQTGPEQAIIFRLSGDYNPLHIDPAIGAAAGFGGVILHGLSTFGFAARALISTAGGGDAKTLKLFGAKFTAPVKPGDALETQAWEVGPGPNGTTEITFITKNLTTGKVVLGGGIAYIKKSTKSKL